jgi:hypothetical protein
MDGRALKFLNVIDEYSSLCLAIRVCRRCRAAEVIDMIEELCKPYPAPIHVRMDNGLHPARFTLGESIRGIVQQPVQG